MQGKCSLTLIATGDVSLKIRAVTYNGKTFEGSIGYADSCSQHNIALSSLSIGAL